MYKRAFISLVVLPFALFSITAFSQTAPQASSQVTPESCPALLDHRIQLLHKKEQVHLCSSYANKVILAVNTASQCGFTPQFAGLEKLYQQYKDQGFVVLGFPSNNFFQDRKGEAEIAKFCRINYGVTFPMFSKSSVWGWNANPFYKALAEQQGSAPHWNFFKYLIDRDGNVVDLYNSRVTPEDPALIKAIEKLL
ncbi:MAG: glutathione peroxidase [Pseudomonadales bacterium]|nr:glutathione peroxidase [Pseudomonadales bacterium]